MDQLWAPWRLSYVATPKDKPATTGSECFICRAVAGNSPAEDRTNLLVHRTELSVVMLNRFPYNNGHILVCPRAHKARLDELDADELFDLQLLLRKFIAIIEKRMSAEGFNVGLNLGRAGGAGVPGHLHWHIVPRWIGDTNFMPAVGGTKVISQALDALYDLLTEELQSHA